MVGYFGVANSWRMFFFFWTGFYFISELLEQLKYTNLAWSVLIAVCCALFSRLSQTRLIYLTMKCPVNLGIHGQRVCMNSSIADDVQTDSYFEYE